MNVEYTGRQYEVTPAIRKQVEHGLTKLIKIFGENNFKTLVILTSEKYRHIAEITVVVRDKPIVGLAEGAEMLIAVGQALDHIERQAIKYKGRRRARKRNARKRWREPADAKSQAMQVAVGANAATAVPVVVHTYPALVHTTEAHVVPAQDAVAMRPLTLEEAIKEAEFRDREVFVFRDPEGRVKILHRTKDGKLELIEAP
jgi:putative sigma-54 modulation protein